MSDVIVKVHLETPRVPNFLRVCEHEATVSVADVPDEALREIGESWTRKLIENAARMRNAPGTGQG